MAGFNHKKQTKKINWKGKIHQDKRMCVPILVITDVGKYHWPFCDPSGEGKATTSGSFLAMNFGNTL